MIAAGNIAIQPNMIWPDDTVAYDAVTHTSSFIPHPSSASSAEAVEPLGQAPWRIGPSSLTFDRSFPVDGVFADLGRDDGTEQDSSEDGASQLLASKDGERLAAATIRAGEEAAQARVPRRSRLQRYEREVDAWFAEQAAVEAMLPAAI